MERLSHRITGFLTALCDSHVRGLITDANHLSELRLILQKVCALYQDNIIADRSLINGIAHFVRAESCRILTISVPEVLEILYVQRTTRLGYRPSTTATSTLFRPVTMADYSASDLRGSLYPPVFGRKLKKQVLLPTRPFRNKTTRRR